MRLTVTLQKALAAFALLWLAGVMSVAAPTTAQAHAQHATVHSEQGQHHTVSSGLQICDHMVHHAPASKHHAPKSHRSIPGGCHCIESCLSEQSSAVVKPRSPKVVFVVLPQSKVTIFDHHTHARPVSEPRLTARYPAVSRNLTGAVRVLVTNMRLRN